MFNPYEVARDDVPIEVDDGHNVQVPRPRRVFPRPLWLEGLRDDEFRNRFRLDREMVMRLHGLMFFRLVPLCYRRNIVSVWDQLLITLR